jgi:hypothetical protein
MIFLRQRYTMLTLVALVIFGSSLKAKDTTEIFRVDIRLGRNYQQILGANVYNDAHSNWSGYNLYVGGKYNATWGIGFVIQNYKSQIIDKTFIFAKETNIRTYGAELSRQFDIYKRFNIIPYSQLAIIQGKNQGSFNGTQFTIGVRSEFHIWPWLSIFAAGEYAHLWIDIDGHKDIIKQYDSADLLSGSFGLGFTF